MKPAAEHAIISKDYGIYGKYNLSPFLNVEMFLTGDTNAGI